MVTGNQSARPSFTAFAPAFQHPHFLSWRRSQATEPCLVGSEKSTQLRSASRISGAGLDSAALRLELTGMIDHLLAAMDVQIKVFALCEVCSDWRLSFGADEEPSVHFVLDGFGAILVPHHEPIPLSQNMLVVLPKDTAHAFDGPGRAVEEYRYDPGSTFTASGTGVPVIRAGVGERRLAVACGTIHAGFGGGLGVFDRLAQPIVERFETNSLRDRFQALLEELAVPSHGTRTLTEAFLKQAVVLVLRRQLKATNGPPAWLKMLEDPRLTRAVTTMLRNPGDPMTVDTLSAAVGMSRFPFVQSFTAAFGRSPMELLKQIRLHHAARLLTMTDLPVKVVAKSVGYESRSYFSRAFREKYGIDPTDYRTDQSTRAAATSGHKPRGDTVLSPSN
jgi:AraC-like DNA-binding protein